MRFVTVDPKRIWIDLDNSPHVPFFAPIIRELERRGYSVALTARDAYQVCELADFYGFAYKRVGRHYGKSKALKVLGTCLRALQLLSVAVDSKPALAVSHGSRSQMLIARILGVPSVGIGDYEFAKSSLLFAPTWSLVPEVVSMSVERHSRRPALTYHGIKEDVYVPTFRPDPSIQDRLGLNENRVVVTVRPPASEAHYHRPESDRLFEATIDYLERVDDIQIILVPRNARQSRLIRSSWLELFRSGKARIPENVENGLNLIWYSDLVISGGGTMNREAAALGVPVYSIFRGPIGAVDRYLASDGRLVLLESVEDVRRKIVIEQRRRTTEASFESGALKEIVDRIAALVETPGTPTAEPVYRQ